MRLLTLFLLTFAQAAMAQPKAVQLFTATNGVSLYLRPTDAEIDNQGTLWYGSENKLVGFNGYQYSSYPLPAGINAYTQNSQLAFNHQDKQGRYWAFIMNNGLYNFNLATKTFTPYPLPDSLTKYFDYKDLCGRFLLEDSKGNLWINLCGYGLLCINNNGVLAKFYWVKDANAYNNYVSASWINKAFEHPDGSYYFATNDGMLQLYPNGLLQIIKDNTSKSHPGCRCILNGMATGQNKNLIINSTWGNGIKIFNTATHQFQTVVLQKPTQNCNNNVLIDIMPLNDSLYFLVKRDSIGGSGFCTFNTRTQAYTMLANIEPKFTSREYNRMVKDGDFIWVPNLNQLYRFYIPALLQATPLANAVLPKGINRKLQLSITNLWVNDVQQPLLAQKLVLQNWQNNLRLQITCSGATQYDSLQFAYRLCGYETNWHTTYNTNIDYNNLPAGNYTLHIKALQGPYSALPKPLQFAFYIQPQWWQYTWVKLLTASFLVGIVLYFFRLRIAFVKKQAATKNVYEKKLDEVEMKALRAQMNPHFIFNCLNSINKYIVKNDQLTASTYLTKFAKLIRLILDNSATDIISLQTEISTLELYLQMEAMRFHNSFIQHIEVDENINTETTNLPSMLVQPYIENAIWHGLLHKTTGEARLTIRFKKIEKQLQIEIEDNGIGRQKAKELRSKEALKIKSYGMQISSDRIQLLQHLYNIYTTVVVTDLINQQGQANGTLVKILLPIMKSQP